ncbi:MAG: glucosaminidase domain-containing protein [Chromatocurvus sp.]
MTVPDPFRRIPAQFRPFAYWLTALFLLLLLWLWMTYQRDEFGAMPDFAAIENVAEMKSAFYGYLTPMVVHYNDTIRERRARLEALNQQVAEGEALSGSDRRWLRKRATQYELEWDDDAALAPLLQELLLRVDTIPVELALAQAAKESGWGRSRFAVEANNLFGQWCYVEGCGVIPANRPAGATHEVEEFRSVSEAMRRYINNLNTHESYEEFRRLRRQLREDGKPLTGMALASGLILYSERREDYVDDIRAMIQQYRRIQAEESPS